MSFPLPANLNANEYTIDDLYHLFKLTKETANDTALKEARRKVLALHPDKAGQQYTPYFIFYRNAWNRVAEHFSIQNRMEESRKQMEHGKQQPFEYKTYANSPNMYEHAVKDLGKNQNFNEQFNTAYEKTVAKNVDHSQYQWFAQETPVYQTGGSVSVATMNREIDQVRKQQQQQQVAMYRGVRELNTANGAYGLYDDDETVRGSTYVSSDPFGKLKYDDLRKVHKDETVFSVSEQQYHATPKYRNVDEYKQKTRPDNYANVALTPQQIEEQRMQAEYERQKAARIKQMELQAYEEAAKYGDLNNQFMSNLLRLN
jgi:hypothetical protein